MKNEQENALFTVDDGVCARVERPPPALYLRLWYAHGTLDGFNDARSSAPIGVRVHHGQGIGGRCRGCHRLLIRRECSTYWSRRKEKKKVGIVWLYVVYSEGEVYARAVGLVRCSVE